MSSSPEMLAIPAADKVHRVVQWSTGKVGKSSLRAVIQHPAMELVGLHVHSEDKLGLDAGEICGLPPTGIQATRSVEEIIALKPDCVLYMQEGYNLDDLCRLLEAGINIVTTRGEFFNPKKMDQELREHIEAACQTGCASLHATGSSPGFITEAIPLVLTSVCRQLDCLTIDEFADIPESCSSEMILQVMGYGRPPGDEFDPNLLAHMAQCFEQSLSLVADALSLQFDRVETTGETALANRDVSLPQGGVIEKGTVAAQRITVAGMCNGQPLVQFRANWYCSTDINPAWELQASGWRVLVEGETPFDISLRLPKTADNVAEQMAGYTAHRAVNAVPYVCSASPGIRTITELPQVIAQLGK